MKMETFFEMSEKSKSGVCVKYGSLVFAILNAVALGISTVYGTVMVIVLSPQESRDYDQSSILKVFAYSLHDLMISIIVVAVILTAIAFAFSIILLVGLIKKRPTCVKIYFIYGVAVLVVSFVASVLSICAPSHVMEGISAMAACLVYSVILAMIWSRYKMLLEKDQYEHVELLETISLTFNA